MNDPFHGFDLRINFKLIFLAPPSRGTQRSLEKLRAKADPSLICRVEKNAKKFRFKKCVDLKSYERSGFQLIAISLGSMLGWSV